MNDPAIDGSPERIAQTDDREVLNEARPRSLTKNADHVLWAGARRRWRARVAKVSRDVPVHVRCAALERAPEHDGSASRHLRRDGRDQNPVCVDDALSVLAPKSNPQHQRGVGRSGPRVLIPRAVAHCHAAQVERETHRAIRVAVGDQDRRGRKPRGDPVGPIGVEVRA